VFAAELQRRAAVQLLDLRQVGLGRDHHARRLAVHEVLLLSGRRSEGGRSGGQWGAYFWRENTFAGGREDKIPGLWIKRLPHPTSCSALSFCNFCNCI